MFALSFIRCLIDAVSAFVLFKAYKFGQSLKFDAIPDIFFMHFLTGIIMIMLFIVALSWINNFIISYTKHAMIYIAASKEKLTFKQVFTGIFHRGKTIFSVVILNYCIRKGLAEIAKKVQDSLMGSSHTESTQSESSNENSTETEEASNTEETTDGEEVVTNHSSFDLSEFINKLKGVFSNSVFASFLPIIKTAFDYVDECVLFYCYRFPEIPLRKAAFKAIAIFIEHPIDILKKVVSIVYAQKILKGAVTLVYFYLYLTSGHASFQTILTAFVFYYCIIFTIEDGILQPMLMLSILNTYGKELNELPEQTESDSDKEFMKKFASVSTWFKRLLKLRRI